MLEGVATFSPSGTGRNKQYAEFARLELYFLLQGRVVRVETTPGDMRHHGQDSGDHFPCLHAHRHKGHSEDVPVGATRTHEHTALDGMKK